MAGSLSLKEQQRQEQLLKVEQQQQMQLLKKEQAQKKKKEQERCRDIAQRMFKKDPAGEQVESNLFGQLDFLDSKGFGFIWTDRNEKYFCHGDALTYCGAKDKDIVKFDVWENFKTARFSAINVKVHQRASAVIATDEMGTISRWFDDPCRNFSAGKGIISCASGRTLKFTLSKDNLEQASLPEGARVHFDIIVDNWTGRQTAVNIRSAKITRHVHLQGVSGRVTKLGASYGFVSTGICDRDLHFNCRELTRVLMQGINCHSRVICDVMMEEDGSLTAESIQPWTPQPSTAIDTSKKAPAVDEDCASTSTKAATDVPEETFEPITPEMRKLLKKLREIDALEVRQDLSRLEQAKVAMKGEFRKRLEELTA